MPDISTELCENCLCAIWAFGLARPILICNKKFGCGDNFFVVRQDDTCKNFKAGKHLPIHKSPAADSYDVRFIPLTQGKFAIVDAEDYDWLNSYKWCICKKRYTFYACRRTNGQKILMHRVITNAPKGLLVDHKDGNGLNNRRSNLRICTITQNNRNSRPRLRSTSKYKGVSWSQAAGKWRARICPNRREIHLGCFDNEIEAALAYDRKAEELFGEFAYLNFGTSPRLTCGSK